MGYGMLEDLLGDLNKASILGTPKTATPTTGAYHRIATPMKASISSKNRNPVHVLRPTHKKH